MVQIKPDRVDLQYWLQQIKRITFPSQQGCNNQMSTLPCGDTSSFHAYACFEPCASFSITRVKTTYEVKEQLLCGIQDCICPPSLGIKQSVIVSSV